jgi:hypothetical protein
VCNERAMIDPSLKLLCRSRATDTPPATFPPRTSRDHGAAVCLCTNRVIKKRNRPEKASAIKGVNFDKSTSKWLVRVSENGKQRYFGRYATQELAEKAATDWKKETQNGAAPAVTATAPATAPVTAPATAPTTAPPAISTTKPPPVKPPAKAASPDGDADEATAAEALSKAGTKSK